MNKLFTLWTILLLTISGRQLNAQSNLLMGAGNDNTHGSFNTSYGFLQGIVADPPQIPPPYTGGSGNTFIGANSGNYNTGSDNTTLGRSTGGFFLKGSKNVFIGAGASTNPYSLNTSGGTYAGSTVSGNSFLGYQAGYKNQGDYNVFLGYQAGYANTTAGANVLIGYNAGLANTTGDANVFMGANAGLGNTTGFDNTFLGRSSGYKNIGGRDNAFLGYQAGFSNTAGSYNTCIGNAAGFSNTTGQLNTLLGYQANVSSENLTNAAAIGANAVVAISNAIVLGDTTVGTKVGIGLTKPQFPLDVQGIINIRGTGGKLKFSGLKNQRLRQGATDQFLTLDENGETLLARYRLFITDAEEWSDNVFSPNYRLQSLAEVEQYIRKNQHLPGIPSAAEVVENGVDAARMDAKLLEKIEELTLHSIEMEKTRQAQEVELAVVKRENQQQGKRIETLERLVHQLLEKK